MARRGRAKHAIAPSRYNDPTDRKAFAKDGGHVHDPVIFVFARPETPVLHVAILVQVAVKPAHVSGKRDCITIKWLPRSILRGVLESLCSRPWRKLMEWC